MKQAVIVSTARTGLAKSVRGGFNQTHGAVMGGHAVKHAIAKAGIDPGEVEDVYHGLRLSRRRHRQQYRPRNRAIWAGCPVTTAGVTINRYCSSGLNAIAMAAQQIMSDGTDVAVGAGVESISLVQMGGINLKHFTEEHLLAGQARAVDDHDRDRRDRGRALWHQPRARTINMRCKASSAPPPRQAAGKFKDEIVPLTTKMKKVDKATGAESMVEVTVDHDECNRPDTTLEGLAALKPVHMGGQQIAQGKYITAGNASQFADGASACVLMSERDGGEKEPQAAGHLQGLRGGRRRAGRNGHRPGRWRCRACSSATISRSPISICGN